MPSAILFEFCEWSEEWKECICGSEQDGNGVKWMMYILERKASGVQASSRRAQSVVHVGHNKERHDFIAVLRSSRTNTSPKINSSFERKRHFSAGILGGQR